MVDYREQIKQKILKKNTNMAQVARRADISYGTLYHFMKGDTNMNLSTLKKILRALESFN